MKVLSNVEFESLAQDQTPRLKSMAKVRCDANPSGYLHLEDLDELIIACKYTGDEKSFKWLGSLRTLATSGELDRIRSGSDDWKSHEVEVHLLCAQRKIPFDIYDSVLIKETGKRGKVVDYLPLTNEYIIVLDPFQVKNYQAKELEKIAKKIK